MNQVVDTNVLLRFLTGDIPEQQEQARQWFKKAEQGKWTLVIKPLVVAETAFVLESFYKLDRKEIADALEVFLAQKWLQVEERSVLVGLWNWYRKNFHFVDSYLLAWKKINSAEILSFDSQVQKESGKKL
jgi:predicted nucleic-acid-binding protein